nr:hypothetical protein [uncultured Flavobacterium sp.]
MGFKRIVDKINANLDIKEIMLSKIITQFKDNIEGLRDFVDLVEPFLKEKESETIKSEKDNLLPILAALNELDENFSLTEEMKKSINDRVGKITTTEVDSEDGKSIKINFEKTDSNIEKALNKMLKSNLQKELLYKSSLMSLASTAEWFTYQLFHNYYSLYPYPLEHKDKFFSLDDLKEFGTIEDAKNFLISTKIDKIMRQGFEEWFSSFKKQDVFSLKLKLVGDHKNDLTEIFQRRHLLVHNGGIVNEFYLQKVALNFKRNLKNGDKLILDKAYIDNAIDTIEFCFLLIAFELWQKIDKDGKEKRIEAINDLIVHYIESERYINAEKLGKFFSEEKDIKEHYTLVGQLNYWQSIKWQDRYNEIKKEVENADYSAKDVFFQTGYFAICDKKEEFFKCLDDAIKNKKLTLDDAEKWPIFKEMRKEIEFQEIMKKYN